MRHPFRIREIAEQSGLSESTVERVLNDRGNVRESTAEQVRIAIADLERQRAQLRLGGRTFLVDVVVDSPPQFAEMVRSALESELPSLLPAIIRARFHFTEDASPVEMSALLAKISRRKTHGLILKAPDSPVVAEAIDTVGAPVVTLVTDLPASKRVAYVGLDNRAAGATAAYLMTQWLDDRPGDVLAVRGSGLFRGDDEREMGFRSLLRATDPQRQQCDVLDPGRSPERLYRDVRELLEREPGIRGVYAMYSMGHEAVIRAFKDSGTRYRAYITHDINEETRTLLHRGEISAVLHHDIREDVRRACRIILQSHRALPGPIISAPSPVHVVTPHNVPFTMR
ncbi:LacI family DNA-binding transcriptional regulator [Hoyosella altamirensis]|uniref:LacI family transcriptional regulator n=1 Tax=Hoyosella altamirensis TaxID=616997 RepID=A0A839RR66_9ACTN|nr:LacI family DNA-binding transcriptional regulator [Hoyosella altamirensis]MBB3039462.1 LacI family transcriptional regulator [Hoyosella altamirensis]